MGKLANIARNVVGVGGEYISLNDLIANYPEGVTVNGVSIRDTGKGEVPCFTFTEDSTRYAYMVSGDLALIFESWRNFCNGDIDELNNALQFENVRIRIWKTRTKKGNTYTKAQIIGEIERPRVEVSDNSNERVDPETGELIPF